MKPPTEIELIAAELKEARRLKAEREYRESDIYGPMPETKTKVSDDGGYRNCARHSFYGRECPDCSSEKHDEHNPIRMGT